MVLSDKPPNAQDHRRRAFLRRPVERLVGPRRLKYPATYPRKHTARRLAGPPHGCFHFGFGRRSWAVRFRLTNDDCDNAFPVSALLLFQAQRPRSPAARFFLRRPVERLVGPRRLKYPTTEPRGQAAMGVPVKR